MGRLSIVMVASVSLIAIPNIAGADDCYECVPQASQPPTPGSGENSEPQKPQTSNAPDNRGNDQRGTKNSPLAVEITSAAEIKPEPTQRPDKPDKKATPKWWPWPEIVPSADWALRFSHSSL